MKTDAQFWNGLAERYSRQPIANVRAYERKLEITKARLAPSDVILDIGCGTGSLAIELAPQVSRVHAVDVSSEMIKIGQRKALDQRIDNITFHESTAQALPDFEPGSLDGVCAYNILHLVRERGAVLQQVMSLLKPGGFLISSTLCLGDSYVPYGLVIGLMRAFGKAPAVEIFRREPLLSEVRAAGFVDVSTPDVGAKNTIAFIVANKPT
jgi:ubiquinone/menaquinone biosynthesis C-methylase UbiE